MAAQSDVAPTRGASLLLLAAIVALALNLRPAMAAVGPLLDLIEGATGMGSTAASLLTTLPVLMIGLGALSIRPLRRRLGERRGVLLGALLIGGACLTRALAEGATITDEASALEYCGYHPLLVSGRSDNIKVTRPEDLALAAFYLSQIQLKESA